MLRSTPLVAILLVALVSACANSGASYRPVVDGPAGEYYEADLSDCQALAASGPTADGRTAGATVAGAGVGAASSVIWNGNSSNAGEAAAVGALLGLTSDLARKNAERESIVKRCMAGRGYNVVG